MPAKVRVYELAREMGLSNKEIIDLCNALGIGVKSHSSSIVEAQADRVRRKADREGLIKAPTEEPEEATPEAEAPKVVSTKKPPPKVADADDSAAAPSPAEPSRPAPEEPSRLVSSKPAADANRAHSSASPGDQAGRPHRPRPVEAPVACKPLPRPLLRRHPLLPRHPWLETPAPAPAPVETPAAAPEPAVAESAPAAAPVAAEASAPAKAESAAASRRCRPNNRSRPMQPPRPPRQAQHRPVPLRARPRPDRQVPAAAPSPVVAPSRFPLPPVLLGAVVASPSRPRPVAVATQSSRRRRPVAVAPAVVAEDSDPVRLEAEEREPVAPVGPLVVPVVPVVALPIVVALPVVVVRPTVVGPAARVVVVARWKSSRRWTCRPIRPKTPRCQTARWSSSALPPPRISAPG